MCNLYSVTKGQSGIRDLFSVKHDRAGNMPPLPAIFPDQMAPIVRTCAEASARSSWRVGECRGRRSMAVRP